MADRSYLYSCDHVPESPEWIAKKALHGIAECRYDIPLVYKILLTGNPEACRSSIWDTPDKIAIVGDYAIGRENLIGYLSRITDGAARPLIDEALQFLNSPAQVRKHFILECGEIFDLTRGSLADKNRALVTEIRDTGVRLGSLQHPVPVKARGGILSKLFGVKPADPLFPYHEIGLGTWSDILYFDFSENEA